MSGDVAAGGRVALADRLAGAGVLDAGWRGAFEAVSRNLFLLSVYWEFVDGGAVRRDRGADPEEWLTGAYRDTAAITQWDDGDEAGGRRDFTSSLSMPTMVARMLGDLGVEDGNRVREVGTGPGFNAAFLAHRLGADRVVSVEIDEAVAGLARGNLAAAGLDEVEVVVGDGADPAVGADGRTDQLIATCLSLVTDLPVAWVGQTVPGGVIVVPTATLFGGGATARLRVADDGQSAGGRFTGASDFMRMRQQCYQAPPVDAYLPGDWPGDARASVTDLDPETIGDSWLAQFAVGTALSDIYYRRAPCGT
ncbi:methyltransferase domain-containing protein [Kitasatospora sp. NPDC059673]|uniref:methyltransferase domain-containing protein n=1 Tax=Kitasatospora sp. NPDC059673 TaxID=3346901 RepID=UPI00367FF5BB